jgi:Bifunctional DNA primase/polymerase, N-terminal/Primase C terminal 1 (PriCT-1)
MMSTMLDAALDAARRGWPVFPVWPVVHYGQAKFACSCHKTIRCEHPGKHPLATLVARGLLDATTDEERVRHWWASVPTANIGMVTGDGRVVLDVDPRHGGDKTLAALEQTHGSLPNTWSTRTGGGGRHLFFAAELEVRNSAGKIGPGIDVKGQRGYVILPPSGHVSGTCYVWQRRPDETGLAPLPGWLLTAIAAPRSGAATPVGTWRERVCNGVDEGGRNDAVTRLAGHLLRRSVDPLVVLEMLLGWNATRCRPPLAEDEIIGIVARITERELERRGSL